AGDRVQEGTQKALGLGQAYGTRIVQGRGVRFRRHGGRESAHRFEVLAGQRAHPPGVMIVGGQPGQQQTAGQQVQGVHGGGTPEQRGPVPVPGSPRTREQRQRGAHGQQHGGNTHGPDARAVRQHDGDVLDGRPLTRDGRRARSVGAPEGDPAGAGGHAGQEQRVAVGRRRQGRGGGRRGGSGLCGDGESSNLTSGGGR